MIGVITMIIASSDSNVVTIAPSRNVLASSNAPEPRASRAHPSAR
jgi:hypothetical protein